MFQSNISKPIIHIAPKKAQILLIIIFFIPLFPAPSIFFCASFLLCKKHQLKQLRCHPPHKIVFFFSAILSLHPGQYNVYQTNFSTTYPYINSGLSSSDIRYIISLLPPVPSPVFTNHSNSIACAFESRLLGKMRTLLSVFKSTL